MTEKYEDTVVGSKWASENKPPRDHGPNKTQLIMVIIAALTALAAMLSGLTTLLQYASDTPQFHLESQDGEIRLYPIGGRPSQVSTLTLVECNSKYQNEPPIYVRWGEHEQDRTFVLDKNSERNSHYYTTKWLKNYVSKNCVIYSNSLRAMELQVYYMVSVPGLFKRKEYRTVSWPGEETDL